MNETAHALITGNSIYFIWAYLGSLILIGIAGRLARREKSMADFYLSGRQMSLFVLFLTLYATQYSGNTLIGFSGQAYRSGFYFLVSVGFMMGVVGVWLAYAPKLQRLSKKHRFITPSDYIHHRFGSRAMASLAAILCIIALGNYMLTNLKAMGHIMVTATGGRVFYMDGMLRSQGGVVTILQAVIALSLIMVIYETLGGMRSVSWTDALQGILLLSGCIAIFWGIYRFYGGLPGSADVLMETREDLWAPPDPMKKRLWLSTLIMLSIGIAHYPHAIQRIYAARDATTLRRSFQIMTFMPLVTTLFMLIVGIVGAAQFPGLHKQESESITLRVLSDLSDQAPWFKAVAILFICAAIAAIMSTVDSALLTASSMIAQDIYKPLRPRTSEHHLLLAGKITSWIIMALMAYLALRLPQTIWRLIEIKLELLCQVAPAIVLGLHVRSLDKRAVFAGMIAGTAVTVFFMFNLGGWLGFDVPSKPWSIHAGLWGLMVNLGVVVLGSLHRLRESSHRPAAAR